MFQEVFGNGRLSLLPLHFFVVQALLAQTGEQLFGSDGFDWRRSIAILQTRFPQLFVRHRQGALRVHLIERLDATAQLVPIGLLALLERKAVVFHGVFEQAPDGR